MSKYTAEEVEQIVGLCAELIRANEELNSKIIAIDAMVKNSDAKNRQLQRQITELKYIIGIYEERNSN
jgi:acyl-CoA reductase-like NAD-dependent aldehyde dehydrogenase